MRVRHATPSSVLTGPLWRGVHCFRARSSGRDMAVRSRSLPELPYVRVQASTVADEGHGRRAGATWPSGSRHVEEVVEILIVDEVLVPAAKMPPLHEAQARAVGTASPDRTGDL